MEKRNMLRLSNEESNRLTKECIQTALIRLMATKDLQKITVSEIVHLAGVSRTAFYNNYSSKEAVLAALSSNLQKELVHLTTEAFIEELRYETYLSVFQRIKDDSQSFRMLLDSQLSSKELIRINEYVKEHYPEINLRIRYLVFGCAGMIRSIILDWFFNGMNENVAEMAALCSELSEDIIARIDAIDPNFRQRLLMYRDREHHSQSIKEDSKQTAEHV